MPLSERLQVLKNTLKAAFVDTALMSPCVLVLSIGKAQGRAHVSNYTGADFESVWSVLALACQQWCGIHGQPNHLRVDCIDGVESVVWADLHARLTKTKRNYFTFGIALDPQLSFLFLREELQANAMLYPGAAIENAQLNEANFKAYAKKKYGADFVPCFKPDTSLWLFSTRAVYSDLQGNAVILDREGSAAGRRQLPLLNASSCMQLIQHASEFLVRQVRQDGYFVYGMFPCFNRDIPGYNTLRHASSTYAMIESWQLTGSDPLKQAIDRSLKTLTGVLIRPVQLSNGMKAAVLVDTGNEVKLGGNAVAILALAKYTEVSGDRQYLSLMEQLANAIVAMLDPHSGRFTHVLNYPDLSVKERFRIIYYDGEAAFALMRLYGLTRNPRWLQAVEMAFDYFIEADHWKAHDHWLSYCANALTQVRPERRYFEFAIRNFVDYLDFVLDRVTTFPTLLELMMAASHMLQGLKGLPEFSDLLAQVDQDKFYRAMHFRANHLLNGYFWPEWSMFFQKPERLTGSFFIRHQAFRVRIDDVEHYLSGLIAYRQHLVATMNEPQQPM